MRSNESYTDRRLVGRLVRLGLWSGDSRIEPIPGGSRTQFRGPVRRSGRFLCSSTLRPAPQLLGIDRRNEVSCHEVAAASGLAPEIVHHEEGLMITRFVEGRP